jgi:hypothetical protein
MPRPGYSRVATVLDAVDIGNRVIVVRDVVCGSSNEGHDVWCGSTTAGIRSSRDRRCRHNPQAAGMIFDPSSVLGFAPRGRIGASCGRAETLTARRRARVRANAAAAQYRTKQTWQRSG